MAVTKWNRWERNATTDNGRQTAERRRFAANGDILSQRSWAEPDYSELKIEGVTVALTNPVTQGTEWNLKDHGGLHGYYIPDTGTPSISLSLYAKDPTTGNWFLVETKASIAPATEFHFENKVRGRTVKLLPTVVSLGGATDFDIICSAE